MAKNNGRERGEPKALVGDGDGMMLFPNSSTLVSSAFVRLIRSIKFRAGERARGELGEGLRRAQLAPMIAPTAFPAKDRAVSMNPPSAPLNAISEMAVPTKVPTVAPTAEPIPAPAAV